MKQLLPERLRAALRPKVGDQFELPADVVHECRGRVRVAAALGIAAYSLFLLIGTTGMLGGSALERRIGAFQDGLSLFLCVALLLVAGYSTLSDRWVMGFALTVEVVLAAIISTADPWATFIRTGHLQGLTWVIPMIILFPLLVPVRPRITLLVSSLCALTMPAGLLVLATLGLITVRPGDYASTLLAGVVAVGIASIAARTVYGAGGQIAAARRVGSYEMIEQIGRGGAGEVWKAKHLLLARPAAIKVMLPEDLQGPREERQTAIARFTHEARVTAELSSPHTVALYDFGISADGSLYYVMEMLAGSNLQHFVYQHGAVEPRRAVHWLQQACHSLGEAHARGLIHRDIKPSNMFLCCQGRDLDFIKVLDFGLSKPAATEKGPGFTIAGVKMGTPGYMAPEQVYGMPVSPATDLYALGCVAYWLLAGATPFDAEDPGALLRMHAQAPTPPLSQKAKQPIPARLEALVMACLAKEPADRPQSADRLRDELIACMDGTPWSAADAGAWWAAHPEDGEATLAQPAAKRLLEVVDRPS